jgi:hypothetical protein
MVRNSAAEAMTMAATLQSTGIRQYVWSASSVSLVM